MSIVERIILVSSTGDILHQAHATVKGGSLMKSRRGR